MPSTSSSSSSSYSSSSYSTSSSSPSSMSSGCCTAFQCVGTGSEHFGVWTLNDVHSYTSTSCSLYVLFDYVDSKQQIEIYKNSTFSEANLVAIGQAPIAGNITIDSRGSSGITGSVAWDGTSVVNYGLSALVCEMSSSSSSLNDSTSSSISSSSSRSSFAYSESSSSKSSVSSSSNSSSISSSSSDGCCNTPYCTGLPCQHFGSWTIAGMRKSNSNNCALYVEFDYIDSTYQQIRIYKDVSLSERVAIGQTTVAGIIAISQRNSSGISGTVVWDGTIVYNTAIAILDCFESSSSSIGSSSSSSLSSSSFSSKSSLSSSSSSESSSSISSSSYSSTSSSLGSSSSSESSSTSLSSESSLSSLGTSSSELRTTSSSSSSAHLYYKYKRTIPFSFDCITESKVLAISRYSVDAYAATEPNGMVLKSSDRRFWKEFIKTDDVRVTALFFDNQRMFIGTEPNGYIYIYDMVNNQYIYSGSFGGKIISFLNYSGDIYCFKSYPSTIYKYSLQANTWDVSYIPYGVINSAIVFDGKMLVSVDGLGIIQYSDNAQILSQRNIWSLSSDLLSKYKAIADVDTSVSFSVKTNEIINPYSLSNLVSDGGGIVFSSNDSASVFGYYDNNIYELLKTDGQSVNCILNLSSGNDLVSISNRVYLLTSGANIVVPVTTTTTSTIAQTTTTTTTFSGTRNITVTKPTAGSFYLAASDLVIEWSSTKGVNESVKIELYREGKLETTINSKVYNTGKYTWIVPLDIVSSVKYYIAITILTAGGDLEENRGYSDPFSIYRTSEDIVTLKAISTTGTTSIIVTTTTTTRTPVLVSDYASYKWIKILELLNDEKIICMCRDADGILCGTDAGRILLIEQILCNAEMTGPRKLYAKASNNYGNPSSVVNSDILYEAYNKILEVNANKDIGANSFEKQAAIYCSDVYSAIFISPVFEIKNDFGFFKKLIWQENRSEGTEVSVCIRAGNTLEELKSVGWDNCFAYDGDIGPIQRDLNNLNMKGQFVQFRINMSSSIRNVSPYVMNLNLLYTTQYAAYFFTSRIDFNIENKSGKGFLMAKMTQPKNTEIKLGISAKNTADWQDYTIVPVDQFFNLNNINNLKIGAKIISYDNINFAELSEFALTVY